MLEKSFLQKTGLLIKFRKRLKYFVYYMRTCTKGLRLYKYPHIFIQNIEINLQNSMASYFTI